MRTYTTDELLQDPCTPFWAADVIRVAVTKDPCDAAGVFEVLAATFNARAQAVLAPIKPAATVNIPDAAKPSNLLAVFALFDQAISHSLKFPKIRLQTSDGRTVVLKVNGEKSKYKGQIAVVDDRPFGEGSYFGRIDVTGKFYAGRDNDSRIESLLYRLAENPAHVASEYGRLTGNCCFCSTPLKDARSTAQGYGPICAQHFGLPWGVS